MKTASVGDRTAVGAATVFLVPARLDRQRAGRDLAGPLLGGRSHDHDLVRRGIHPDLIELAPPEGKERIGIDQVRGAIHLAQFAPVQAERKVCLIPRAETLTPEAANALLKTLEEPPRGLVFALLAEHSGDLLPTIVSRSRLVRVPAAGADSVMEQLREAGYEEPHARWLVAVADREGEIEALLTEPLNVLTARRDAVDRVESLDVADLLDTAIEGKAILRRAALVSLLVRMAKRNVETLTTGIHVLSAQNRETIVLFLQDLLAACFDLVRASQTESRTGDRPEAAWVDALNPDRLRKMCTAIDQAHRAVSVHGPIEAILLSLFLTVGGDGRGA
jgi:DNA-binding transcriptional ArsR family regulator